MQGLDDLITELELNQRALMEILFDKGTISEEEFMCLKNKLVHEHDQFITEAVDAVDKSDPLNDKQEVRELFSRCLESLPAQCPDADLKIDIDAILS